ncbi:hemolysin family protein [Algoriphagus boritolerans]|uniref:Putative hemolysin n=1 Tax=Algoriphagus boritolerans DSM 17298 = JCM 18970 TaxID=1120964 RepID=A0A1H5TWL5_9BACT|nr:hemolysin family protein [Algoriphagus boritolerans]SEF67159.1 putative hemolysin [Algoriphagus boritolerans DSM 17298 = JCM 18970]
MKIIILVEILSYSSNSEVELLIILLLVLLNGVFAMSELSLVSVRKFKLENAKRRGSSTAKVALELAENPTKFLSTVQIGITLIGILLGVYSGENLTTLLKDFISKIEFLTEYASPLATGITVLGVTYLSIVLGELFPKRLGMTFPEPIAMFVAKPMRLLSRITAPFVWLLSVSNDFLLTIFGIKNISESKVSEEEIKAIIKESAEGGEITDIEQDIVERVFELGDRRINTLFTHRTELVYFNVDDTWEKMSEKINSEKHAAYPVCKDNDLDDIVGMVLLKDLFAPGIQQNFDIRKVYRKPLFINENSFAYQVLELFKKEKMHYGIVIDEYGSTMGIVSMDDVIDALVGDASESDHEEYQITQRDEKSWLVDGQFAIIDFVKYFDLNILLKTKGFTTVAGLMIHKSASIPEIGDKVIVENLELEVVDKDGQRIDKIMVKRIDV